MISVQLFHLRNPYCPFRKKDFNRVYHETERTLVRLWSIRYFVIYISYCRPSTVSTFASVNHTYDNDKGRIYLLRELFVICILKVGVSGR